MGPYSETVQARRRANLEKMIANNKLNNHMKIIWKKHLHNLAVNEDEYNARVKQIYKDHSKGIVKIV